MMHTVFSRRRFLAISALTLGGLAFNALPRTARGAAPERTLIAYFTWSGNTRGIARLLHQKVGGDLVELEPVTPYSENYDTCLEQAKRDQEQAARPELKTRIADMGRYDTVFLGYPNWWASIPMPIASFLEQYDFSGKTIVPFVSHGGGRLGQSLTAIAKLCPSSRITEALSVRYSGGSSLSEDMDDWLKRTGMNS